MSGVRWDTGVLLGSDAEVQAHIADPTAHGGSGGAGANNQVLASVGTPTPVRQWVYSAPGPTVADYMLVKDPAGGPNWGMVKKFDVTTGYFANADPAVVITSAATALTAAGGGTIAWSGQVPVKSAITISAGVCLWTPGAYTKAGDPKTARIWADTGFNNNWLVKMAGNSCALVGGEFDANGLNSTVSGAGITENYGVIIAYGNRIHMDRIGTTGARGKNNADTNCVAVSIGYPSSGTGDGADSTAVDCDFRMPTGYGIGFALYTADWGESGCHHHGCGNGAGCFVASYAAHHTHLSGCHFECGDNATPQATVYADHNRVLFNGCKFGQANDNPELWVGSQSRISVTGCSFYDGGGLSTNNTIDCVYVQTGTSRLVMTGNQFTLGDAAHGWRYAVNTTQVGQIVTSSGNQYAGAVAGSAFNHAPLQSVGDSYNDVAI